MEEERPEPLSPEQAAEELRRSLIYLEPNHTLIKLGGFVLALLQFLIFAPVYNIPPSSSTSERHTNLILIILMGFITLLFWFAFHSDTYSFLRKISTRAMAGSALILGTFSITFLLWSHNYVCKNFPPGTKVSKTIHPYGKYNLIPMQWEYSAEELNAREEHEMKVGAHIAFSLSLTWGVLTLHWLRIRRRHEATN